MDNLLSLLEPFVHAAFASCFAENIFLARGFGLENLCSPDTGVDRRVFCVQQTLCSLLSVILFWPVEHFLIPRLSFLEVFGVSGYYSQAYLWIPSAAVCLVVTYFIIFVFTVKLAPSSSIKTCLNTLPMACFNTLNAAVIILGARVEAGLPQYLGAALGSDVSYHLCSFIIDRGKKKFGLDRGDNSLPAILIYTAGLAMAVYALAGHQMSSLL